MLTKKCKVLKNFLCLVIVASYVFQNSNINYSYQPICPNQDTLRPICARLAPAIEDEINWNLMSVHVYDRQNISMRENDMTKISAPVHDAYLDQVNGWLLIADLNDVKVVDITTHTVLGSVPYDHRGRATAVCSDGKRVFLAQIAGIPIRVFNLRTGHAIDFSVNYPIEEQRKEIRAMAILNNSLYIYRDGGPIKKFDIQENAAHHNPDFEFAPTTDSISDVKKMVAHGKWLYALCYEEEGRRRTVRKFDAITGAEVEFTSPIRERVLDISISSDGILYLIKAKTEDVLVELFPGGVKYTRKIDTRWIDAHDAATGKLLDENIAKGVRQPAGVVINETTKDVIVIDSNATGAETADGQRVAVLVYQRKTTKPLSVEQVSAETLQIFPLSASAAAFIATSA